MPAGALPPLRRALTRPSAPGVVCALVGLAAMLATLTGPSFWTDEGATLEMARRPLDRLLATTTHIDGVHALYYALMHGWVALFGDGEFAVRVPSAICYAATVYLTVALARELGFSSCRRWLVGALLLVLPGLTWVGLEARDFALATMLATLNMLAFARRRGRGWAVVFALSALLMPFAEIFAVLLWPIQGLWLVTHARRRLASWLALLTPALVATGAFIVLLRTQTGQLSASEDLAMRCWALVRGVFFYGPRNGHYDPMWPYVLAQIAAAVTLVLIVGVLVSGARRRRRPLVVWLALWAYGPMLVVFMVAFVSPGMFGEHYFAFCAPGLVLALVAAAWAWLGERRAGWVCVVLVVLLAPMQLTQRAQDTKAGDDYRSLIATMPSQRPEVVWFDSTSARSVRSAYPAAFAGMRDVRLRRSGQDSDTLWGVSDDPRTSLTRLRQLHPHQVLVVYGRAGLASSSGAAAARELGCRRTQVTPEGRYSFAFFTCGQG